MLESLGFSASAESVYLAMLPNPHWSVQDLAERLAMTQAQVRAALDELADMALVRPSISEPGRMRPANPMAGFAALLGHVEAQTRAALSTAIAHYYDGRVPEPVIRLATIDDVRERLEELADNASAEFLILNPSRSRGLTLDQAVVERGVQVRCIYQDSVRNDPATFDSARWLCGIGGQVRTTPAVPVLMVIVDRRVALVPMDPLDCRAGAIEVAAPGIVSVAVAYFEQMWSAASELTDAPDHDERGLTSPQRALLGFLAAGNTDEMAARRLGVSLRTVRRMTAELMARLEARSRFQAGIHAARRGWLD